MGSFKLFFINALGVLIVWIIISYQVGYFELPNWYCLLNAWFIGIGMAFTVKEILWIIEQIKFYRLKKKMQKENKKDEQK